MNQTTRWVRILLLVLGACLSLLHCVIGGNSPCQTTANCPAGQTCFSGICLRPGSEGAIKSEPTPTESLEQPTPRRESPPGVDAPPGDGARETIAPDAEPSDRPDKSTPEDVPEPINYGPQRRIGLTSGGGSMSSAGYRLYGSISAGIWAQAKATSFMSSPSYRLRAGIIAGTTP